MLLKPLPFSLKKKKKKKDFKDYVTMFSWRENHRSDSEWQILLRKCTEKILNHHTY
jgi:hypothetical protein